MSGIITEAQAAHVFRTLSINESRAQLRTFSAGSRYNIFLSHKHDEIELVRQIKAILEALHSGVYVDWEDATMPTSTTGETALRLKRKIREMDKFIFLASNGAIASKWCNWEIGYGDAFKLSHNKFAIFPVKNNEGWKGAEYLQLYPRIEFESAFVYTENFGNPRYGTYQVIYPDGRKMTLENWLNG